MNPQLKQGRWGLKGKLITAMLLVGAAPLLIGLGMAFLQGTRELHEAAGASFASLAGDADDPDCHTSDCRQRAGGA